MGIQGMKNFANAKLLQSFSAKECLCYVLSLPIHCTAVGCTTLGQLEDDVRIAQQFKPYSAEQMVALRDGPRASPDRDWRTGSAGSKPASRWSRQPTPVDELFRSAFIQCLAAPRSMRVASHLGQGATSGGFRVCNAIES